MASFISVGRACQEAPVEELANIVEDEEAREGAEWCWTTGRVVVESMGWEQESLCRSGGKTEVVGRAWLRAAIPESRSYARQQDLAA